MTLNFLLDAVRDNQPQFDVGSRGIKDPSHEVTYNTMTWHGRHNVSNHRRFVCFFSSIFHPSINKANMRDLIPAAGLVILLKSYQNRPLFSSCDLEIWWVTSKQWDTSSIPRHGLCIIFNPSVNFLFRVTLKFFRWPWKTIGHFDNATSSFLHHFIAISKFKLGLESGNVEFV